MFKIVFCKAPEVYLFYAKQVFEGQKDFILHSDTVKFIGEEQIRFVFFKTAKWTQKNGIWKSNRIPKKLVQSLYWIDDEKGCNEIAVRRNLAG